jgi:hypothetical protein
MSVSRMLRFSLVAAFAMACSSDSVSAPFRGFMYAAVAAQCGPADGPAVAVFLAPTPAGANEQSGPYVRVYVAVLVNRLTGVWPIASANTEAAAWFHPNGSTYEIAESGYMIVTSVDSDNTVTGSVDIRFPDSGHIKTAFRAKFRPNNVLCA